MDRFKILSTLQAYCNTNNIAFLAGSDSYQNYEASQYNYAVGQLILGADFRAQPVYSQAGNLATIRYRGVLSLGRKFDSSASRSELDETFIQKVTRRLEDLMTLLAYHSKAFACENELLIISSDYDYKLNEFDENIDFVTCNITFEQ